MTTAKTYSRARSAVAAVKKILEAHEATGFEISTAEPETGRFTAAVVFEAEPDLLLLEDLTEAGFAAEYPEPEEAAPVEESAKSPSGYIREKSTATNAVATVWAIADAMPGAARKDVIEACRLRGVAYGTARTQYQAWKKAKG